MASVPADATTEDARVARTRADVARATLDVLTSEGFDDLTHARVARVAGYSKTTLYTHWPSRFDLLAMALDSLGAMPHSEPTGDLRSDLIAELVAFRTGVAELGLDRILMAMAQWGASVEEIGRIRTRIVADGEQIARSLFAQVADGVRLEAAVQMLSGVVVCPTLMHGDPPSNDAIAASVDILLAGVQSGPQGR